MEKRRNPLFVFSPKKFDAKNNMLYYSPMQPATQKFQSIIFLLGIILGSILLEKKFGWQTID